MEMAQSPEGFQDRGRKGLVYDLETKYRLSLASESGEEGVGGDNSLQYCEFGSQNPFSTLVDDVTQCAITHFVQQSRVKSARTSLLLELQTFRWESVCTFKGRDNGYSTDIIM